MKTNTAIETFQKATNEDNTGFCDETNRLECSSPYDNLFLNTTNDMVQPQSVPKNNDGYTSDDSVYQSEDNQSSDSMRSITRNNKNNMISNGLTPNNRSRKQVRKKNRRNEEKSEENNRTHIGMAVRRTTASVIESRFSASSQSVPRNKSICPIHDESDIIGNVLLFSI